MENVVIQKTMPGKAADEILGRIKELKVVVKRNQTELVKAELELGWLFNKLKDEVPGGWAQALENLKFSQRRISRLMKSAKVLAPNGTVSQRLAEKLPADPLKMEALSALDLNVIETLIRDKDIDLRQLDRGEIGELVRLQLGTRRRSVDVKPTGIEAFRQSWNGAVETHFQKLRKLDVEEREPIIEFLDGSLDRLKASLQKVDEEKGKEDDEPADQEGDEPTDQAGTEPANQEGNGAADQEGDEPGDQADGESADQENEQGEVAQAAGDETKQDAHEPAEEKKAVQTAAKPPMKIVGTTRKP